MQKIDAHQHFWLQNEADYPWLIEDYGPIYADFVPADLEPQLLAAGVDATVIVQSANTYKDTNAMLAQAGAHDWVAGVVGWVPLTDPSEAARKLDDEWLRHPKFCGVRHLNHEEADPDWLVRPDVLAGLGELERRDVAFDVIAVFPEHLAHVPTIAEARPGLRMVIDHLAKPPIASGDLSAWAAQIRAAAAYPNVYAKVSGLNTAIGRPDWDVQDLIPSIGVALQAFGVDRLLFGSDWPVAILAGDYAQVWSETLSALEAVGLSQREKEAVLGGTAAAFYRLEVPS